MANQTDKHLSAFIQAIKQISELRGVSANNPLSVRVTVPMSSSLVIVVASFEEPATMILPLNVLWLNMNPNSGTYLRLRQRSAKNGGTGGLVHTWTTILTADPLSVPQTYDNADKEAILASVQVNYATTSRLGLVRLSCAPVSATAPIVAGSNDPRMSDARAPLPHTHALPPVTQIKAGSATVTIDQNVVPQAGMVLIATSGTAATWRALTHSDVVVA